MAEAELVGQKVPVHLLGEGSTASFTFLSWDASKSRLLRCRLLAESGGFSSHGRFRPISGSVILRHVFGRTLTRESGLLLC